MNLHPCQMKASPPFCVVMVSIAINGTHICGYNTLIDMLALDILRLNILGLDILGIMIQ